MRPYALAYPAATVSYQSPRQSHKSNDISAGTAPCVCPIQMLKWDGFLQNPLPDVGLEGVLEREVDALAQQLGQLVLEPREIEEGRRFAELDQHIDVAAASLLAARVRAEQPQRTDRIPSLQVWQVLAQHGADTVALGKWVHLRR